jgi:hypothetical protein
MEGRHGCRHGPTRPADGQPPEPLASSWLSRAIVALVRVAAGRAVDTERRLEAAAPLRRRRPTHRPVPVDLVRGRTSGVRPLRVALTAQLSTAPRREPVLTDRWRFTGGEGRRTMTVGIRRPSQASTTPWRQFVKIHGGFRGLSQLRRNWTAPRGHAAGVVTGSGSLRGDQRPLQLSLAFTASSCVEPGRSRDTRPTGEPR